MQNQPTAMEIETPIPELDNEENDTSLADQSEVHNYNYEKILLDTKASLIKKIQVYYPNFSSLSESDPMLKTIEIAAYRELLIRQKIKDTIKISLLSQSSGTSLNQLAHLILDENKYAKNFTEIRTDISTFWNDTPYYTTGTKSAYQYFVRKFGNETIRDVNVVNKDHAVTIYILLNNENKLISSEKIKNDIQKKIENENIRRITDKINIQFAEIVNYTIEANITLDTNYSLEDIEVMIKAEIEKTTEKLFYLHKTISTKLFFKIFYKNGVKNVSLKLKKLVKDNTVIESGDKLEAKENEALRWNKNITFT